MNFSPEPTEIVESLNFSACEKECLPVCSKKDFKGERSGRPLRSSPSECKPPGSSDLSCLANGLASSCAGPSVLAWKRQ